ncbi:MAG: Crp/Fnr family transcriptional regulator [Planctomycetota bacterium]|nr:MAG: Crp/Fnr family transcriptional regulator [Planctomycetota bacterium]
MAKSTPPNQTENRLLDRLPDESKRLLPSWETIPLPQGYVLSKQDGPMSHVYFPTGGVCSVVSISERGKIIETATVGNEGMIGLPVLLGLDFSPITAISQVAGEALRMPAASFLEAMRPGGALDRLLRRYIAFVLRYLQQTIACNALHSVEERMCRWLLMTHDRVGQEEFILTQEFLAEMLGVRRQSVTVVAGTLQRAGLIAYRRGAMRIIDREGLEAASCECYEIAKTYYERIMG